MAAIQIEESIILTQPLQAGGFSWTFASRLGEMLTLAQTNYGPRDMEYTILGIEFIDAGPKIWYPGNCKNIVIQLHKDCMNDVNQGLYQLAHEALHCLSPQGNNTTNKLEEGLATYFAKTYMNHLGLGNNWFSNGQNYANAMKDVETLIAIDTDIIKKVRQIQPTIGLITKTDLEQVINGKVDDLVTRLSEQFI